MKQWTAKRFIVIPTGEQETCQPRLRLTYTRHVGHSPVLQAPRTPFYFTCAVAILNHHVLDAHCQAETGHSTTHTFVFLPQDRTLRARNFGARPDDCCVIVLVTL